MTSAPASAKSFTVAAPMPREPPVTSATLYDVVGSVKAHFQCASREGLFFFNQGLGSFLFDQGSHRESSGGLLVPPTIYSVTVRPTMIRFSDAPASRGSKLPNQPSDELAFTRVAPGGGFERDAQRTAG